MKKKIKLRDMTEEQFYTFRHSDSCTKKPCDACPFHCTSCSVAECCWAKHKDIYSDKFLDQEIEIEVPDILTKQEKEYLNSVLEPYRHSFFNIYIQKFRAVSGCEAIEAIQQNEAGEDNILLLSLMETSAMPFKGIAQGDSFTLEELGL
jgi:hypothetical protein